MTPFSRFVSRYDSSTPLRFVCLWVCLLACLLACLMGVAAPVAAGVPGELILLVDRTDDFGLASACLDAVPDDCSLRGAITHANGLHGGLAVTLELPAGVFELTVNGAGEDANITGDLDIHHRMTIRGQGRDVTIVSGGELAPLDDRLVEVHSPNIEVAFESLGFAHGAPPSGLHSVFVGSLNTVRLDDCSFRHHGDPATGGGALRLGYGVVFASVEGCVFESNRSVDVGAAISSAADVLAIRTSTFLDNAADDFGGAVYLEPPMPGETALITVGDSVFQENVAYRGGAVWSDLSTGLEIHSSTFRDNQGMTPGAGDGSGGALYSLGETSVTASTFVGNASEASGAAIASVWLGGGPQAILDVYNSTFSANLGLAGDVAPLYAENAAVELLHVTALGHPVDVETDQADLAMQNSLLTGGCDLSLGTFQTHGGNWAVGTTCWGPAPHASDQEIHQNLALGPLAPNGGATWTHMPGAASPLLGAAPTCPDEDQRGLPRPATDCTVGAAERQPNEGVVFADGFESGGFGAWSSVVN